MRLNSDISAVNDLNEYSNSLDHILDELRLLDVLLENEFLKFSKYSSDDPLENFRGIVITESEIESLFREDTHGIYYSGEVLEKINCISSTIESRLKKSIEQNIFLTLIQLKDKFCLTDFELKCVVIGLAIELSSKYEKIYAYLQDDVTCKKPTIELVFKLLCTDDKIFCRKYFHENSNLVKNRIIHVHDNYQENRGSWIRSAFSLDKRISSYLLNQGDIDDKIRYAAKVIKKDEIEKSDNIDIFGNDTQDFKNIIRYIRETDSNNTNPIIINFYGLDESEKIKSMQNICSELGKSLVIVDCEKLEKDEKLLRQQAVIVAREAKLQDAFVCLENLNIDDKEVLLETLVEFLTIFFILDKNKYNFSKVLKDAGVINREFNIPDEYNRLLMWNHISKDYQLENGIDFREIAGKFRFTKGHIKNALDKAGIIAKCNNEDKVIKVSDLHESCRFISSGFLSGLAKKINPKFSWEELILPKEQLRQLDSLCDMFKLKSVVYGEYGFGEKLSGGKGLSALFAGLSGTGKTMAAEVMAHRLGLDMYKIDLSMVVSKYIGETEKNLQKIFDEAYASNAILFFDEADSLFGKRTEVKDAHDRYANIETSYLLQKMEEYDGIAMLATNLKGNLDDAFARRLSFSIDFPMPDKEHRLKLWKSMFTKKVPVDDIDYKFLSENFEVSGGNIKNIVLAAAFMAAKNEKPVSMKYILTSLKNELKKAGKTVISSDFGEYYKLTEGDD